MLITLRCFEVSPNYLVTDHWNNGYQTSEFLCPLASNCRNAIWCL